MKRPTTPTEATETTTTATDETTVYFVTRGGNYVNVIDDLIKICECLFEIEENKLKEKSLEFMQDFNEKYEFYNDEVLTEDLEDIKNGKDLPIEELPISFGADGEDEAW